MQAWANMYGRLAIPHAARFFLSMQSVLSMRRAKANIVCPSQELPEKVALNSVILLLHWLSTKARETNVANSHIARSLSII